MPRTARRTLRSTAILAGTLAALPPSVARIRAGPQGPEAGVWVTAKPTDFPTKCAKIVVTDDAGR